MLKMRLDDNLNEDTVTGLSPTPRRKSNQFDTLLLRLNFDTRGRRIPLSVDEIKTLL